MNARNETAVLVPLFPRHPGIRHALASLREQTRRPDLVVLLDNGTDPDAGTHTRHLPEFSVEIMQTDTADVAEAINLAVAAFGQFEFMAILTAHCTHAPARLEQCIDAMHDPARERRPGIVVTAEELINAHNAPLAADDARQAQLGRLWAPGRAGISIPEWLGAADFILSPSNLFARRSYLAANPLPVGTPTFHYHAAIQAAVPGWLAVLDVPLLRLNWPGLEASSSVPVLVGMLRAQLNVVTALREKLASSSEARRNFSAFHRAAWSNLSGLREDLFLQAALQLAALADPGEVSSAIERVTGTGGLIETPPFLRALRDGTVADPTAYTLALAKVRAELAELREDHSRMSNIVEAARRSGWVQFAAWLGDQNTRKVLEMEEDDDPNASAKGQITST